MLHSTSPRLSVLRGSSREVQIFQILVDTFFPGFPGPTTFSAARHLHAHHRVDTTGSALNVAKPLQASIAEDGKHVVDVQPLEQLVRRHLVTLLDATDPALPQIN